MKGVICLTKTIGDIVLGNVLVKNIKLKYPDIELDYIVEEKYIDLVIYNPHIKNVFPLGNWDKVLKVISDPKYDKVFFAQQTSAWDNCWHQKEEDRNQHLLDFYAKRCDIELIDRKLEIFAESLPSPISTLSHPVIAIHTKTLADVKDWSKFSELATVLKERTGGAVVQLAAPTDPEIPGAHKISLPLKGVISFFKEKCCNVFIGLDSGLSYIAASFDVPSVILQGATIPLTSGPYGPNVVNLFSQPHEQCIKERKGIRCHGIDGGKCKYGVKCINKITVENIIKEVTNILKGGNNG